MNTTETFLPEAEQRLSAAGYFSNNLEQMALPELQQAPNGEKDPINYVSFGSLDAQGVILVGNPMYTRLDPHYRLRLGALQTALGDDFRVIGYEAFIPDSNAFTKEERKAILQGDFSPLSARGLRVAEAAGVTDEHNVLPYGYSLAADTAVQLGHDVIFNESRGNLNITAVGANEPARTKKQNVLKTFKNFGDSGKEFYSNAVMSGMPALNEAFGIVDSSDKKDKKAFDSRTNKGIGQYTLASVGLNWAIGKGFSTNQSELQLDAIIDSFAAPTVLVTRQARSTVTGQAFIDSLVAKHIGVSNLHTRVEEYEHSIDDHIPRSAARGLLFISLTR